MVFTQDGCFPYLDIHGRKDKDRERTETMGSLLGSHWENPIFWENRRYLTETRLPQEQRLKDENIEPSSRDFRQSLVLSYTLIKKCLATCNYYSDEAMRHRPAPSPH